MFGSPRPVFTMPAASNAFRLFAAAPAAAAFARRVSGALALAAVALPAHAAHRAPARATPHAAVAASHASSSEHHTEAASGSGRHGTAAHTASTSRGKERGRRAEAAEETAASPHRRGQAVASSKGPRTRRERQEAEAAEHEEALAALRERADRHSGRHASAVHEVVNRRESTRHDDARRDLLATRPHLPAQSSRADDTDEVAETRVQDRVHAWYRAHHPGSNDAAEQTAATTAKPSRATGGGAVQADMSPTPRKATADDFAHAAAVQRATIAAAHDQQAHQTTADDDNADAESRIPSTAPTERVPAPFVHGNFGTAVASTRSQQPAAPIVRQSPAAPETAAIHLAPPEHVDLKHRGDGLNSAIAADRAANSLPSATSPDSADRSIPVALAADSSPAAIRALAQQTANSPTPTLKLPAPPSGALRKEQPAVAAVESGARRRDLDPAVTSGMAQQTFDRDDTDDNAPAPARTAIALAGGTAPNPVGSLLPNRTHMAPAAEDAAANRANLVSVNLFDRQGKLILVPPMKGSHEILVHQNQMAVSDGLDRIQDDGDMLELRQHKLLVALPDEDSTYPDDRLPANRRYARPWTVRFVRDLAKAHYARFGTPLIVTSAARTVAFQRHLVRVNGNAAPPTGDVASPHLYGQAIDIGKGRMNLTELTWMRAYLTPVENDGKIDVEEEFQQSCFHISVYRRYLGLPAPRRGESSPPATLLTAKQSAAPEETKPAERKRRRISTALLATGIR